MRAVHGLCALVFAVVVGCSWRGEEPCEVRCWSADYCPIGYGCEGGGGAVDITQLRVAAPEVASGTTTV